MSGYRKWILIAGLIIGVLLEVTIIPGLNLRITTPHILFLFALYFAYRCGPEYGFGLGLTAGYLKDIFSIGILGSNAFAFAVCGLIMARVSTKFYHEWFLSRFITIFFISLAYTLFYYLFNCFFIAVPGYLDNFTALSLKPAFMTALVASPFFALLDNIFKYTSRINHKGLVLPPLRSGYRFKK